MRITVLGREWFLLAAAFGLTSACAAQAHHGDDDAADGDADVDAGGGDGDVDGDSDSDGDWDAAVCDEQDFVISMEPVRVQILLDQSSSMGDDSPWGGGVSHWEEATSGLQHMLEDPANRDFFFGLDAFPDGTLEYFQDCNCPGLDVGCMLQHAGSCNRQCDVDLAPYVAVERAALSSDAILEYMGHDYLPGTFTNTPLLAQMRWYDRDHSAEMPELYANDGASYMILVSDGDDTCDVQGDPPNPGPVITALGETTAHLRDTYGIQTIAIGFGDTQGAMADELNAIASNGGTVFNQFFAINEAGALQDALDAISSTIATCTYDIDSPDATADPEAVNFYFDGAVVGYDAACADGWHWTPDSTPDHPQVEFCGASCEDLGSGSVEGIQARFGCATILW